MGVFSIAIATGACTPSSSESEERAFMNTTIVGGTKATAFPEAALIDGAGHRCSGAVIAPRVVLTAGHCIKGDSYTITLPYAQNQQASGSATWSAYTPSADAKDANPDSLDVAAILLDTPIALDFYPPIATRPIAAGTMVMNVGRVKDAAVSITDIFVGKPVAVKMGSESGFPLSYTSAAIVQSGDSGGPAYAGGSGANRFIVAVNQGVGEAIQVMARVDFVVKQLQDLVASSQGGAPPDPGPNPGPTPAPAPDPEPAPAPNPTGGCVVVEAEPNNDVGNQLGTTSCGALTAGDIDWFQWTMPENTPFDLRLAATSDAQIQMAMLTPDAGWQLMAMSSPTRMTATTFMATTYAVRVASPSGSPQQYTVSIGF